MEFFGRLECSVKMEQFNEKGVLQRRSQHNQACVTVGRDQLRDIILRCNGEAYPLKQARILDRFLKNGKATIVLNNNTYLMLSNVPPDSLRMFVNLIRVKTKLHTAACDRKRLYSNMPTSFEDISPLTVQDVNAMKGKKKACIKSPLSLPNKNSCSQITPVRATKRSLQTGDSRPRKKLHSAISLVKLGAKKSSPLLQGSSLTDEQTKVLGAVKQGLNVFFTGSAGTGKSYLLKKIIGALPPETTVASASTGVAACQIGGVTLHSFAGIGSGEASLERCIELASRPSIARNWKKCKVLVIDEISMIDASMFDKLEHVARHVRGSEMVFGGIQLIICGDFLQLPPVARNGGETKFCFQAKSWQHCIQLSLELTDVKRQNDEEFVNLLQYIRVGKCPEHVYNRLMETRHNCVGESGVQATKLCTHKCSAEEINQSEMRKLKVECRSFQATDSDRQLTQLMDRQLPVLGKLQLKVGAQVMLTKNLNVSEGLVNGARGVILKFQVDGLPLVQFSLGSQLVVKQEKFVYRTCSSVVTRVQLPLRLAWAISIHKSQGLTLDCCEISLARVFEHGQAYVALSRAKSLRGLRVVDMNRSSVKANRDVLRFYIKLRREIRMVDI